MEPTATECHERLANFTPMALVHDSALSHEELARYSRHLILPEVGLAGQRALKAASVLLVGAGGLGSPLGLYLAAAGIGRIGLVDDDVVDVSNLQRQIIHGTHVVGVSKVESAAQRMADLNPHVEIVCHGGRFDATNAFDLASAYDVVVDGTDNFPTRFLVNDACVMVGTPNVYGSVYRFEGQASVFHAHRGPCYRCLFPHPPPPGAVPSCAEGGVLGVLPGVIGLIQATETIKLITGLGETLVGRLLLYDALAMRFSTLAIARDPDCPVCGAAPTITSLREEHAACDVSDADAALELQQSSVKPDALRAMLDRHEPLVLLDVREPYERDIVALANTHEIPLGELDRRMHELPEDRDIIVYCRSGVRSAQAANALRKAGFARAKNLERGVLGWIDDVDPTLARY